MAIDYHDRGAFHKVVNHTGFKPNHSHNPLIRYSTNALLKAETTGLFAKDIITNKLVGKEFHIKFERVQNTNGKFVTKASLRRVNAPVYKQPGIIHSFSRIGRRFEGDTPNISLTNRISSFQPTSKAGKVAKGVMTGTDKARRGVLSGAKKIALSTETIALTTANVAGNKLIQNLRNNLDGIDTGKAALSTITTLNAMNNARKIVIQHHLLKANYKIQKESFINKQQKLKQLKRNYKNSIYSSSSSAYKRIDKKIISNQKKAVKTARKLKKFNRPKPLVLTGLGAITIKSAARISENISRADPDNDFATAISKTTNAVRNTRSVNRAVKNHKVTKSNKKAEKLNKQSNKLKERRNKLQKEKSKKKKTSKPKKKSVSKKDKVTEAIMNFIKFIFRFFGFLAAPLIIIVMFFAIILLLFGGGSENNTYVLGTYNCNDYSMAQAIDEYTEIAYDFNREIINCQSSSNWRVGLNNLGVNPSDYDDTPTEFIFGYSPYFQYSPAYDFDYDKFIAFMCAYTYDFSTDNEDIALWTYNSDYEDVIQELFDTEYEFQHRYINTSHWVTVNNYTIYPGSDSFWYVDETGTTTVNGRKYGYLDFHSSGLPSEMHSFTNDKTIHFDLNTGEIKNRRKEYGKTGFYVQNLDYEYRLSTGSKINSFYKNVVDSSNGTTFKGFKIGDTWHHKTQLYVNGTQFNYAMAKEDVRKFTGNNSENRQLVRDFKQEEYITECKLYTNVKRKKTFDESIRYILNNSSHASERIEFYNTLLNADNIKTYGNHQMFMPSPLPGDFKDIISGGKIYNGYGFDMQQWNKNHCDIFQHEGIDIEVNSGTNVYSMIDGKVESIDTGKHTIVIATTENLNYWYEDNNSRATKVIYTNITPKSGLNVGDTITAGSTIGKVDTYKHCYDNFNNTSARKNYLHITVQIKYGIFEWDWHSVDPRFLIYREND